MRPACTFACVCMFALAPAAFSAERPAEAIQDNSFLIEEAYNQEAGVVQHIFNLVWERENGEGEATSFVFTQEWPVFSQTHQLSYTVPYSWLNEQGDSNSGLEDVMLNYRLQALSESDSLPAVAPRLSLIFPTGDEDQGLGFGSDTVGLQFNLPVSKIVADRWTLHGNAGVTWLPDVQGHDLVNYNLGASAIYALTPDLNLMLEWVGTWDREVDGGQVDGEFATVISPGVRYAINLDQAQLVLGLGVPIGLNSAAPDYGVFLYLSFEHGF